MSGMPGFDQIGLTQDPSLPELLFRSWRRGESTQDEYFIGSATWVADHTEKYPPIGYSPLQDAQRTYAIARVSSDRAFDAAMNKKIGVWFHILMRVQAHNTSDLELLVWCLGHCSRVGLTKHAGRLATAIKKFDAIRFPNSDFEIANASQKLDALERERLKKGRTA